MKDYFHPLEKTRMKTWSLLLLLNWPLLVLSQKEQDSLPFIIVLGTAQDGGYPHIGCDRTCCQKVSTIFSFQTLTNGLDFQEVSKI